jgi:hypothetical protein
MGGVLAALLLLGGEDARAQDLGAPTPMSAAACTVEPRSLEYLAALLKAAPGLIRSGMQGTPVATPTLPERGSPADAATVGLVTATAREAVACHNAGNFPRLSALYSDHYLVAAWGGAAGANLSDEEIAARIEMLATPIPVPEEHQLALVAVEDVRVLPDSRVLATVINSHGQSRTIFIKSGDRYLIEWAYALPDEGTPAP